MSVSLHKCSLYAECAEHGAQFAWESYDLETGSTYGRDTFSAPVAVAVREVISLDMRVVTRNEEMVEFVAEAEGVPYRVVWGFARRLHRYIGSTR